jgi:ABC-type polysaccharide/polyol phosphate export permease
MPASDTGDAAVAPARPFGSPGVIAETDGVVYDSARRPVPILDELRTVWAYRGLLQLLVSRDLVLRYKRSLLGVWWTLLNPLLTMTVLWVVFSQIFRFEATVPYAAYVLSGIVLYTFFDQVLNGAGGAMLASSAVLSKMYVPPVVLCLSAALAATVNLAVTLLPLFVIILVSGVGVPLTLPLIVVPVTLLLMFGIGLGLLIAPMAVRFQDTMQLLQLALLLGLYASPVVWPASIVPDRFATLVQLNPLYHFLVSFRHLLYEGTLGPWTAYAVMGGAATLALIAGVFVFDRAWRDAVVML